MVSTAALHVLPVEQQPGLLDDNAVTTVVLTKREQQICALLPTHSRLDIAGSLGISRGTVDWYVKHLRGKTYTHDWRAMLRTLQKVGALP